MAQSFQRAVNQFKCLKWKRGPPEVLTAASVNGNGKCAADSAPGAAETSPLKVISVAVTLQGATEGFEV